jgi:hypothetical protein
MPRSITLHRLVVFNYSDGRIVDVWLPSLLPPVFYLSDPDGYTTFALSGDAYYEIRTPLENHAPTNVQAARYTSDEWTSAVTAELRRRERARAPKVQPDYPDWDDY